MTGATGSQAAALSLLLTALRSRLTPADEAALQPLLNAGLDWPFLLELVDRHRVAPLLWRALRALPAGSVDAAVLDALRTRVDANTRKALLQVREMLRLRQALQAHDIAWLVFKGPVLAMQAYGDLSLRHAGDLDVLIAELDVATAERLLEALGYQRVSPGFALSPRQRRAFADRFADFGYLHGQHQLKVELHWRLFYNRHLLPLDGAGVSARGGSQPLGGVDVAAMAWSDLMLYLCAHGAKHGWFRLFWLVDVDRLLQGCSEPQQQALLQRAIALGAERMVLQALLLAHRLLATPVAPAVLRVAERDEAVARLVAAAMDALTGPASRWSDEGGRSPRQAWRMLCYGLRLRRGLAYRWRELTGSLVNPPDWQRLRLPDALFFLYLPLRPLLRWSRGKGGH